MDLGTVLCSQDTRSIAQEQWTIFVVQSDIVSIVQLEGGSTVLTIPTKRIAHASPLRYPGGKSSLVDFVQSVIERVSPLPTRYVEPFGGGAGCALELLRRGVVSDVVINDLDPLVHAFWDSAVNHSEEFIERFDRTEVTLQQWDVQRAKVRKSAEHDQIELGFAFFFLNRTNRSGILNAGVIGGRSQSAKDKIDARFNRGRLRQLLTELHQMRGSIEVRNQDGGELIEEFSPDAGSFIYADPPYYDKGQSLYLNAFKHEDHESLARILNENSDANWILTYDNVQAIVDMFPDRYRQDFTLQYSAHTSRIGSELLVVSDRVARFL